jgi:hypothetical protein
VSERERGASSALLGPTQLGLLYTLKETGYGESLTGRWRMNDKYKDEQLLYFGLARAGFQFNCYGFFMIKHLIIAFQPLFRSINIDIKQSFISLKKNCSMYEPWCTLWPLKRQFIAKS